MRPSLGRRLLGVLLTTVLLAWTATAFFSYVDARRAIGAMLDDHLRQSAELLLSHTDETPAGASGNAHGGWVLAFQVRHADGRVLRRSADVSDEPFAPVEDGFADVERSGERWRAFALRDTVHGLSVQVAERYAFRNELAGTVASHLLHPLAVALPALAGLIWLSVGWGLAPLRTFAADVVRRDPDARHSLAVAGTPQEVLPVAQALDGLFSRVAALIEKERRFTADAAHELRTPLAAIKTQAQVALASVREAGAREAITRVVIGTDRAAHLVEQLLLLARLDPQQSLKAAPVRLDEVAQHVVAELAPWAANKAIDLGLDVSASAPTVLGDAALLGALLRNLVDNAVRYTPPGGRVDVVVEAERDRVRLRVVDDGPGIPAPEHERIFDRFYRGLGSMEPGSGLGLSIVARIADLHGATPVLSAGAGGCGLAVTVDFATAAV
ncbi:ATP-binding protein [Azospirillum sp.]|uniref:ATP-binding protein n=1 Tax=Azospirillum sp. TaxID=34012 RepID=UPI003D757EEB